MLIKLNKKTIPMLNFVKKEMVLLLNFRLVPILNVKIRADLLKFFQKLPII